MKVTVCFGETKVVVPVGDGRGVYVKDLIDPAVVRYKKATNKIVAIYDEQEPTTSTGVYSRTDINNGGAKTNGHNNGYANSENEITNCSETADNSIISKSIDSRMYVQAPTPPSIPARFRASRERKNHHAPQSTTSTSAEMNSVLVGEQSSATMMTTTNLLVVRRGSEPVLNAGNYDDDETTAIGTKNGGAVKRRVEFLNAETKHKYHDDDVGLNENSNNAATGRFARTGARKSRLTDEWLEVAAQAAEDYRAKKTDDDRWEDEKDIFETIYLQLNPSPRNEENRSTFSARTAFEFEPGFVENEKEQRRVLKALIVKRTPDFPDSGFAESKDGGGLQIGDCIVDLNGRPVGELSFEKAVEYFYQTCDRGHPLTLVVTRFSKSKSDQHAPPQPVFPAHLNRAQFLTSSTSSAISSKQADSGAKPSTTSGSTQAPMVALQKGNTRRIGQRLKIDLRKYPPPDGFGFTLTSRDNEFSSPSTSESGSSEALVYVKTICPNGAAIDDGRLKAGDRLLEVNGIKLSKEFGQPDVVKLLRQVRPGDAVNLVVSRQATAAVGENQETEKRVSPALPRPLNEENGDQDRVEDEKISTRSYDQMILTFDIPLNDTGSAGLGVSVKGRMAPGDGEQRKDGGIFVKTILHGGAVHKDGRLRVNDRVVAVDGVDLSGLSNAAAMHRLRSVMMDLKPTAQSIHLTVVRVVPVKEKEQDGDETTVNGGKHRLLVNENSTNNGAANKNLISYGDDDYAVIVKNSQKRPTTTVGNFVGQWPNSEDDEPPVMFEWCETAPGSHRPVQASRSDSTGSSWTGDRLSRKDYEEEGSSEALFVRDAPTRRSMSEKRHGAAKIDPSSTSTFQRIQHQRQTSAPSLQRRAIGGGSLITSSTSKYETSRRRAKESPSPLTAERRSMSLESVTKNQSTSVNESVKDEKKKKEKPLLHEEVAQSLQKSNKNQSAIGGGGGGGGIGVKWLKSKSAANRQRPTNESFRQAVDKSYLSVDGVEVGVDVYGESPTGRNGSTPPQEPHYAQITHSTTTDAMAATNRSRPVNKEKDRRKSTGSGLSLKNLFRFGSGGKANRPFAVVSPVNNESKLDDDENEYETYSKLNKKEKENDRGKSQDRDRRIRTTNQDEDLRRNIFDEHERLESERSKYQENGKQKNQEQETKKQLEAQAIAKKQHEEEQFRIRQHYERMKGQQLKQQQNSTTTLIINSNNNSGSTGSNSPKPNFPPQSKMPTNWRPPVPTSSPPQMARTLRHPHPVMGREMAVQVQHNRQHSAGGSTTTTSSGSRLHSPLAGQNQQQYQMTKPAVFDYYAQQGHGNYYQHYQLMAPQSNYVSGYADGRDQGVNNRQRVTTNNNNSAKTNVSPQSSWFVDGSSARHHRFYYSSMDGRQSERVPTSKNNGVHPHSTTQHVKDSLSTSQLTNARARCTSEHVDNWRAASPSTSSASGAKQRQTPTPAAASIGDGTSNRHQRNGHQQKDQSSPNKTSADGRHRVIIGSIPIFDSRKNDGVTRIIIDHNNGQAPPPPPPDYEQYLRTRHAKKGGQAPSVSSSHQTTRPCSEFIGDEAAATRYESSSLPRRGNRRGQDETDAIMATPPARDVHYFYHPQQQLK